jgi:hypothetical protein
MIRPIIIESASRGRRLDPSQSRPRSLEMVGQDNRPVLSWILHALGKLAADRPLYVGGYHIEKVIESFPGLDIRYHDVRSRDGELAALCGCVADAQSLLLIDASTVVLPGALEKLCTASLARGVYDRDRLAGLYFLAGDHVAPSLAVARTILQKDASASIEAWFDRLTATAVDVSGLAAPIVDQEAVARTIFRGKAQALDNLAPLVRKACFLPRERISLSDWTSSKDVVLDRIQQAFSHQSLVVRSSASGEDDLYQSAAGKYVSMLDVKCDDRRALQSAIERVIASYGTNGRSHNLDDEILVQPYLADVQASGVLLTRDPRSGAPYFVLNEDNSSGRSDVVTGGGEGCVHQHFAAWSALDGQDLPPELRRAVGFGKELIELSYLDALDIEYAVGKDGRCHLLQARPLPAARRKSDVADDDLLDLVAGIEQFVEQRMKPLAGLVGATTAFGVMPDWNPAEMIGLSPRPLALSLYQTLIGSEPWAQARHLIGYRDVRPESLIVSLGGRPYVDVRASLNSFLPASLDDSTGAKWVDACLERLRSEPTLHDKIEFEIAITCLGPDWPLDSQRMSEAGIVPADYARHLRPLTAGILQNSSETIGRQLKTLEVLGSRRSDLQAKAGRGLHAIARDIAHHLHDCRRLGLVPFSILARCTFVAMSYLRGFARTGVIDDAQYQDFLRAIPTVAGTIAEDIGRDLPVADLVARYGHLRPNSYEITSPNYAADPERFLRTPLTQPSNLHSDRLARDVLGASARQIEKSLSDVGLDVPFDALIDFLVAAIAGRERAKFEFMKSLDAVLECTAKLGELLEFDRNQLSFLPVEDLLRLSTNSFTRADRAQLRRTVTFHEKRWAATRAIRLPDLVCYAKDVLAFRSEAWRANFVTRTCVSGRAFWLDDMDPRPDLAGAIVITRAADPGYDWIFAHGIAGLVTQYGGVASHMAIRAAEFGLPAAIGCGALTIDSLRGARMIELDCAAERVRAIG